MRSLVIGGNSGFGAGIASKLGRLTDVKTTGKELNISEGWARTELLRLMESADIVVSSAYCDDNQQKLLMEAFKLYKDCNKVFVNIESVNAWREGKLNFNQIDYAVNKLALVGLRKQLQKLDRKMIIIGVCPDTIDTDYNSTKDIPKMSIMDASEVVFNVIKFALLSRIEVSEVHFRKM